MGIVYGLATSLSIGMADLFGRRVSNSRGPVVAAAAMQFVAIFTSLVSLGVVDSSFDTTDFGIGLVSGLGIGVGMWAYLGGLRRSSSAVVAPIVATMSAVVPYLYAVVRGSDPTLVAVGGAVISVAGLLLITLGGGRVSHLKEGVRWAVMSGCGYGFGLSIVIEVSDESGSWPAVGQRSSAFVLMVVVARVIHVNPLPPAGLRAFAFVAGVFAGFSTVFYLLGLQANATAAVVTASLFPAMSVVVGRIVYRDDVATRQALGIAVVIVGVVFVAVG